MAIISVEIPGDTLRGLDELSEVTGVPEGGERMARLMQDALRTYTWIARQQCLGRQVTALKSTDLALLQESNDPTTGTREYIYPLVVPERISRARRLFGIPVTESGDTK